MFLGILQGFTEFLPISSSGHLVLVQSILPGFEQQGLAFDLVLHAGTLLAVVFFYKNNLVWLCKGCLGYLPKNDGQIAKMWVKSILIATIPAGVAGVLAHDYIESLFETPMMVSILLCGTGVLLFLGEWLGKRLNDLSGSESDNVTLTDSIYVGIAQSLALLPGISRSGTTMAAGLAIGWSRQKAAHFSFLLMIPAVSGAIILKSGDLCALISEGNLNPASLITGFFAAFVSGYCAMAFLLRVIRNHSFAIFGIYCVCVGAISLTIQLIVV